MSFFVVVPFFLLKKDLICKKLSKFHEVENEGYDEKSVN